MPLYDVKCDFCGEEFEDTAPVKDREHIEHIDCTAAPHASTTILITNSRIADWFKPHFNEHLGPDGSFVTSQKHLKDLCIKHDVTSRALGDVRNITEI